MPQDPQDPSTDQDFLKAGTADQLAYLRATDKDFAAASPQDQINYLRSVTSSHIGTNTGAPPTGSAGYQYSTGYAGPNDAPRDSGGFIDRLTTQAGRAMQSPSNFLPSWTSLLGPLDPTPVMNAYKQWQAARGGAPTEDPAKTLGNMVPAALSALVTHAGDSAPNLAEAAKSTRTYSGVSNPLTGIGNAASTLTDLNLMDLVKHPVQATLGKIPQAIKAGLGDEQIIYPAERPAPAWQANPPASPPVSSWRGSTAEEIQANIQRMADNAAKRRGPALSMEKAPASNPQSVPPQATPTEQAPTPEEAANNQRFLDAFKQAKAGRPTPNAETSIPHDIEAAQQKVFFDKDVPDIDVGKKVREANPEPTRAEVKAGQTAKAVGPAYGPQSPPMEAAQSSTIDLHGYKPENRTMTVQFKNGNVYELKGVPQEIWNNYKNSESQGSYYQQNLKGRYETRLVGKVGKNK